MKVRYRKSALEELRRDAGPWGLIPQIRATLEQLAAEHPAVPAVSIGGLVSAGLQALSQIVKMIKDCSLDPEALNSLWNDLNTLWAAFTRRHPKADLRSTTIDLLMLDKVPWQVEVVYEIHADKDELVVNSFFNLPGSLLPPER